MPERDYTKYGTDFLKGVLAKIGNAELRTQWETSLLHPDAKVALEEVGKGAFFQSDYSRAMDELATKTSTLDTERGALAGKQQTLDDWWEQNHPKVIAYDKLAAEGKLTDTGTRTTTGTGTNGAGKTYTEEELKKFVNDELIKAEVDAASYMETVSYLQARHLQDLGKVLHLTDQRAVTEKPNRDRGRQGQRGISLEEAYDVMFK